MSFFEVLIKLCESSAEEGYLARLKWFKEELSNFEVILNYEKKQKEGRDANNNKKEYVNESESQTDGISSSCGTSCRHGDERNFIPKNR